MRHLSVTLLLVAASLASCIRFDPADDARTNAAIAAGGVFLSTLTKCLGHIEQARNTATPACNASKEMEDYDTAKRLVRKQEPKLESLQQQIQSARSEVESAVIGVVVQAR